MMKTINKHSGEQDKLFAALKIIEALYQQGLIKSHVFRNILKEYENSLDISQFQCYDTYLSKE